ncbi:MAG: glycosyltransferase [Actinobacteria bacterium]|nr:glycosyltransferase [Actinomycetota bacterium]
MADRRTTVVMITRDRVAEATRALATLARLPEQPPAVVVDNGSPDGTAASLQGEHPDVELIALPHNLGAAGRTLGVRAAASPYVAFCDDDTSWEPGALARAADLLDAHPTVAVVAAHVLVGDDGRDDPVCREMADSPLPRVPELPGVPILGFLAGMSVVRRDAYLSVGGFLLRDGVGGEEAWLAADLASAGWHLIYVPDVVARHLPSLRRDTVRRRRVDVRNALWFTWSRRRPRVAAQRTMALLRAAWRDRDELAGVVDALRGIAWVRRHRRPLAPVVETGLRQLDAAGHR